MSSAIERRDDKVYMVPMTSTQISALQTLLEPLTEVAQLQQFYIDHMRELKRQHGSLYLEGILATHTTEAGDDLPYVTFNSIVARAAAIVLKEDEENG